MDELITPVKSVYLGSNAEKIAKDHVKPPSTLQIASVEDVVAILNSKPDVQLLGDVLQWLHSKSRHPSARVDNFRIRDGEIKFSFLDKITNDFWPLLRDSTDPEHKKIRMLLLSYFSNVAGVASLASFLRLALHTLKSNSNKDERKAPLHTLTVALTFTAQLLKPESSIYRHWEKLQASSLNALQKLLAWKDYTSILASGRVLSLAAEAQRLNSELVLGSLEDIWVADGKQYSKWLGHTLSFMLSDIDLSNKDAWDALKIMFSKALTLGYSNELVGAIFRGPLSGDERLAQRAQYLIWSMPSYEQKRVLFSILHILSASPEQRFNPKIVGGAAALLLNIVGGDENRTQILSEWLVRASPDGSAESREIQKAVVLVIVTHPNLRKEFYQNTLQTFGDKLWIRHAPLSEQETSARILCLLTGHLFRLDKSYLQELSRRSLYLNMISNRLASSSNRSKILGMTFATIFSSMIDPEERMLKFEEVSEDFEAFTLLTKTSDRVGSIADLNTSPSDIARKLVRTTKSPSAHVDPGKIVKNHLNRSKIVAIEEMSDSEAQSEDEDLMMFAKPDTDESDEEEDATLVQRNRPSAPVYIRDLLAGLRDIENFDRHRLALEQSAGLIRRKTGFGSEVVEHIEELATQLIGLDDKYDMNGFQGLRMSSMIAVLLADPSKMGPWFSATFFNGDYSMSQRVSVLSTLGLGARELAGLSKEDMNFMDLEKGNAGLFPSKKLPEKLHRIYATEAAPVEAISNALESSILKPIAARAADDVTGPNVLKVRTFSSRLAVEGKRQKAIPNQLARVVADAFFLPLVGRWRIHRQAFGDTSVHDSPLILSHYIKTLSIILNAAGRSTLSLPQMSAEFWDVLLAMRNKATDMSILKALLFGILTLLNINDNNEGRLAADHSRQLLETREWVQLVHRNLGGESEEDHHRRSLAEAVLVMIGSIIDKYQRSMLGDLADYL